MNWAYSGPVMDSWCVYLASPAATAAPPLPATQKGKTSIKHSIWYTSEKFFNYHIKKSTFRGKLLTVAICNAARLLNTSVPAFGPVSCDILTWRWWAVCTFWVLWMSWTHLNPLSFEILQIREHRSQGGANVSRGKWATKGHIQSRMQFCKLWTQKQLVILTNRLHKRQVSTGKSAFMFRFLAIWNHQLQSPMRGLVSALVGCGFPPRLSQ